MALYNGKHDNADGLGCKATDHTAYFLIHILIKEIKCHEIVWPVKKKMIKTKRNKTKHKTSLISKCIFRMAE